MTRVTADTSLFVLIFHELRYVCRHRANIVVLTAALRFITAAFTATAVAPFGLAQ